MAGIAETQELVVNIRYVQTGNPVANISSATNQAAARSGAQASQSWTNAFNKGLKSSRFTDIIGAGATGGLKFLERTTLAAAAAGGVLELQFIRVQDAQAAFARTLTGESTASIARATAQILELSKAVPLSVTELYRIGEVIGTTNVAADSIGNLTAIVAKLASTTDLSADEAAIGIARLLNMFGQIDRQGHIATGAADDLADAIFRSSLRFASSDQEILRASLRFGALADAMHLTQGQVIALSGAVTGLGQEPEAVGGSFQRTFQIINKAVGQYRTGIDDGIASTKRMAELAGLTSEQFAAGIESTVPGVAGQTFLKLIEGFSKLTPTEQAVLFGKGGIFPSFVRGAQTLQNLGISFEAVNEAAKEFDTNSGQFEDAFAKRTDTLAKNFQLLINAVTRGAVAFGGAFDEEMGGAIQKVTQWITDNEGAFESWGKKVADAIKGVNWDEVKQTVGTFFDIFATGLRTTKALLDALPDGLVPILLYMKTINSLSGGLFGKAIGGVVGGIGGALAKLAIDKNWVQKVWVTNPTFGVDSRGGPAGAVGGGLGLIGKVFIVGMAAEVINELSKPVADVINGLFKTNFQGGTDPLAFIHNVSEFGDLLYKTGKEIALTIHDILGTGQGHPPATPTGGFPAGSDLNAQRAVTQQWRDSLVDEQQAALELSRAAGQTSDAASSLGLSAAALLKALKPAHRTGERGKSIESAEHRALQRLDPSDPNFIEKLTNYTTALVKHYTDNPPGTPGHSRAFVLGAVNKDERSLGRLLKDALRSGDTAKSDALVAMLKALDTIPGNTLPAGIEKLITKAEAQKDASDTTNAKLGTVTDKLTRLQETLQRKRLQVRMGGAHINVRSPAVRLGATNVTVRIGARTVTRVVRSQTAWGPSLVFQQPGQIYEGPN